MCHHGCTGAIDRSLFVLATTESGIEAALRRVAARSQCGAVTLLVPHLPTGASDVDRVKRWQTLAVAYRVRHAIAFPIVMVEFDGPNITEVVEQATPPNAVILIGGRATPSWRPWRSYPEWLTGWLVRTGRRIEFVAVDALSRAHRTERVGLRVLRWRTARHFSLIPD